MLGTKIITLEVIENFVEQNETVLSILMLGKIFVFIFEITLETTIEIVSICSNFSNELVVQQPDDDDTIIIQVSGQVFVVEISWLSIVIVRIFVPVFRQDWREEKSEVVLYDDQLHFPMYFSLYSI